MRPIALLLLLALSAPSLAQDPFKRSAKSAPARPAEIYHDLEEMPEFPGGAEAMQKYMDEQINRPGTMRSACSHRKIIASFVVNEDGSISQVDIVKSINGCPDFDYEVMRAIRNMPRWIPARLKGQAVRCLYKMPVYIS